MLSGARCLLHRNRVLAFDHETVEVFVEQNGHGLWHRPDDAGLDAVEFVKNGQSAILKDRVGIRY